MPCDWTNLSLTLYSGWIFFAGLRDRLTIVASAKASADSCADGVNSMSCGIALMGCDVSMRRKMEEMERPSVLNLDAVAASTLYT